MKRKILKREFFCKSAQKVARNLLGKVLVRKVKKQEIYLVIIETEAYLGKNDLASHARFGKTKRNQAMFEKGGLWYVYFIYGMHWLLNVVTGKKNEPSAVLIRKGIILKKGKQEILGPAKITKLLKINGHFTGKPVSKKSNLWIEDWSIKFKKIKKLPRVGVDYAGSWAKKPLRFVSLINGAEEKCKVNLDVLI
jgi:DNA-3-methyladenine glycosylase